MPNKPTAAIILAAGKSTRMVTNLPKVLHEVCGRPMLSYVLDACRAADIQRLIVVVGYQREQVVEAFSKEAGLTFVAQTDQKGTGHAAMMCREALADFEGNVVVIAGDMPLVRAETLQLLIGTHRKQNSAVTLATAVLEDATGYGRIVRDEYGNLQGIVEESDCTPEQKQIKEINPSYYCFDKALFFDALNQIEPNNVKGEYYITDALHILVQRGHRAIAITAVKAEEAMGVNSRAQLAEVGRIMQNRIQAQLMQNGVTIVDPANTWIDIRAQIGQDTVIYPFSYIHGRVKIGSRCVIGPFAYLRDGTAMEDDVVVAVFTELKNSKLGTGTRVRHLSYIGDAHIGERVNVGAGTIFANFDGRQIHEAVVGSDTYIGNGSILVAPLEVPQGLQINHGSVVRESNLGEVTKQ
ncbi:MAG TPA: NTP transferase domain-containing protein [Phycisphaerae bacterium]|nr:NTP transferase domain-containing protein [Phycisphaerae bacterium]HRY66993.1 NTP transferase domain-containing protein [Phycisphaerae bacterium]HSA28832.1 NTP transferase domain-containing protein [Phycisphaerae bacterium]